MGFGILASDYQHYLEVQRWLFLDSELRARIFIGTGLLFLLVYALWHTLQGDARLVGGAESKIYGPVEIHKKFLGLQAEAYSILLLGGSTTRELTYSDQLLSDAVSTLCQREVSIMNAGSSGQSYIASRSLYDLFAKKNLNLIVLGTNLYRYDFSPSLVRKHAAFNQLSVPISLSTFFSERTSSLNPPPLGPLYIGAFLTRNENYVNGLSFGRNIKAIDQHTDSNGFNNLYVPPAKSIEDKRSIARKYLLGNYLSFLRNADFGASRWNDFFSAALGDGVGVIVLDLPFSPSFVESEKFFREKYDQILESHRAVGAHVVNWRASDLGLKEPDFFDQQHLLGSGRRKIEPALIQMISKHIPGCGR